jgi:hypothetical protein
MAAIAALALSAPWASAQSDEAQLSIVGPPSVEEASEPAQFDVVVANAPETGGFQFILAFDPDLFEYSDALRGDFLGSTGRDVQCEEPQIDVGAVLLICVTLGAEPAGATGNGTLFSVLLTPKAPGTTTLDLTRVVLSTPPGDEIPATATRIGVEVTGASDGINWLIWGPVIGGVALLILMCVVVIVALTRRGRADATPATPDYGSSNSS